MTYDEINECTMGSERCPGEGINCHWVKRLEEFLERYVLYS